ncbi:MAG: YitT family protein [Oscillospiraceae bacterium]|nr:YitT family protein [Oscillospiraceae bacterium]
MKRLKNLDLKKIVFLTFAGIINAIGITIFLNPVKLYDSGISGTSMLISQITIKNISLSLCLLVLNIPIFLYGLKKQGKLFTVYSIYTVAIYSISAWLITDVMPIDVSMASPLAGTDLLLCAIFGGVISGVGSGLAIRCGGAMDGIEVLAVMFAKRLGLSVGTFVMAYNVLLYVICGLVLNSWILPLYSIVTYMAALKVVDFIVEGIDRSKSAMIITTKPDEICKELSDAFESGTTKIEAVGGYSNSSKTIVYFVVNRFQVTKMKDIVRRIDSKAYITISEVADVFANN